MKKDFEKHWKEFMKGNYTERPPEDIQRKEIAILFYELGFSIGTLKE